MNSEVFIPEPISKNIFEQYLKVIEIKKYEIEEIHEYYRQEVWIQQLDFIDKIINGIERSLQDINSHEYLPFKEEVNEAVLECLNSWILFLASWHRDTIVLKALAYNYTVILFLVLKYPEISYIDITRYTGKLSSPIAQSDFLRDLAQMKAMEELRAFITQGFDEDNQGDVWSHMKNLLDGKSITRKSINYHQIDPLNLSDYQQTEINNISDGSVDRYSLDFFNIREAYDSLFFQESIDDLRDAVSFLNIEESFEQLFLFDDSYQYAVWEIEIQLFNEANQYNASEVGFLIWSFTKALETIDGIEIELVKWGEGSKWYNLKLFIKSVSSKIDLKDVLKTSRQMIETAYTKKPSDELRKFESEKDKLNAEVEKIKKESANIMDLETAKIAQELSIQNQLLDLQKKEIEIEEKKADVILKKLEGINKISELIKDGVIQNNSNIQIMINNMLYLRLEEGEISRDKIEYIDIKEKIQDKPEDS